MKLRQNKLFKRFRNNRKKQEGNCRKNKLAKAEAEVRAEEKKAVTVVVVAAAEVEVAVRKNSIKEKTINGEIVQQVNPIHILHRSKQRGIRDKEKATTTKNDCVIYKNLK